MWKFWKKKKKEDVLEEQSAEGVSEGSETAEDSEASETSSESMELDGFLGSAAHEGQVELGNSAEYEESEKQEGFRTSEESAKLNGAEISEGLEGFKTNEELAGAEEIEKAEGSVESYEAKEETCKAGEDTYISKEESYVAEEEAENAEGVVDEAEAAAQEAKEAEKAAQEAKEAEEAALVKEKKGFFARLREGLAKTRDNIARGFDRLFTANEIDDDFYEELEEILIMGDIGVNATTEIIDRLKAQVKERHLKKPVECKELLIQSIREQMEVGEAAYNFETRQSIIMVIGVNGVGKTTTVGKLAWKLKDDGKKVLIAAADTFRAAAGDQLAEWARRAGVPMIGGKEGADPASVVYDAVNAAKARGVDVLLVDTAGRLHNKKNLMEELRKMNRIIDKEYPNAHRENLIVLDGTTGQNALAQAREFGDVTNLTGIVLTKMDGTAKGGIAVAIQSELGIPVKYIGVGETTQDLQKFNPDDFVRALFDVDLTDHSVIAGADAPENMEDDL
jgi:fused signal recognition particle receptor